MANMKNAKKKIKVIEKQTTANNKYAAPMKTAIKKVDKAVGSKNKELAQNNLKVAIKKIDKATSSGVVKKNTSSRQKSRLTKKVNAM